MMYRVMICLSLFGLGCSGSETVSRYCTDGGVSGDGGGVKSDGGMNRDGSIMKTTDAQSDCIPLPSDTGREVKLTTTMPKDANRGTDSGLPDSGAMTRDSGIVDTGSMGTGAPISGIGADNLYPSCVPGTIFMIGQESKKKEDPTGEQPFITYIEEYLLLINRKETMVSFSPCGPVTVHVESEHDTDYIYSQWKLDGSLIKRHIGGFVLSRVATLEDVSKFKVIVTDLNSIFKNWYGSQTKKWIINQVNQSKSCEEYTTMATFNPNGSGRFLGYPDGIGYSPCN